MSIRGKESTGPHAGRSDLCVAGAIVLAALIVLSPAVRAGFILDDSDFLTANPIVKAPDGLRRIWLTMQAPDYYPLSYSLMWIEWRLWGMHATGYHLVNIFLHAGAALLLWRVLKRLHAPGAWMGGILFAIHPVAISSAAWIAEAKNTVSMVFYLASLLLYLRSEDSGRKGDYGWALLLFFLALCSKSSVVVLPVALLLCAWWRRGPQAARTGADERGMWRRQLQRLAPFFALGIIFGLIQIGFHSARAAGGMPRGEDEVLIETAERAPVDPRPEGFLSRVAASGWAICFYLMKAVLPIRLMMIYPRWYVAPSRLDAWVPLGILLLLFLLFAKKRKTWGRALLFSLGYFALSLGPVLGFIETTLMRHTLVADHWQYIALPGVTGLVGGLFGRGWHNARWRSALAVAGAATILAAGALAFQHAKVFQSEETLWANNLKHNPGFAPAYNNLGMIHWRAGDLPRAIREFEAASQLDPENPLPFFNLGRIYDDLSVDETFSPQQRLELLDMAIAYYRQRMALYPDRMTARLLEEALQRRPLPDASSRERPQP